MVITGLGRVVLAIAALGLGSRVTSQMAHEVGKMNSVGKTIRFKARFTVTESHLQIEYAVENSGTQAVYLVDMAVVVSPGGEARVEPARPRIEFLSPDTAVASSKLFPLPTGALTAVPRSAYANRLGPGELKQGVMVLLLPLRDYRVSRSAITRQVPCNNVEFTLGMVPHAQQLTVAEQFIAGKPVWRLDATAWLLQQELTVAARVHPPVPVSVSE